MFYKTSHVKALTVQAVILSLLIFSSIQCNREKAKVSYESLPIRMQQISWIIGEWHQPDSNGFYYEVWDIVDDHSFKGYGYMVLKNDTIFSERLEIKESGGEIYYIPTLTDQNSGQPVMFRLTKLNDSLMIFENPDHDFPQRIVYTHFSEDSLHAWIEGMDKGKERREDFRLVRK
jgi:hypothetical protein